MNINFVKNKIQSICLFVFVLFADRGNLNFCLSDLFHICFYIVWGKISHIWITISNTNLILTIISLILSGSLLFFTASSGLGNNYDVRYWVILTCRAATKYWIKSYSDTSSTFVSLMFVTIKNVIQQIWKSNQSNI